MNMAPVSAPVGDETELPSTPALLKLSLNQKTPSSGSLALSEASKRTDETTASCSTTTALSLVDPDEEVEVDDREFRRFPYAPTTLASAQEALVTLRDRLMGQRGNSCSDLKLESMKESFDLQILTEFYHELMIPNFPLEEERDDLDDWLLYLDPAQRSTTNEEEGEGGGPSMDVLILRNDNLIIGGIAFEYYPRAHAGLLSYMVVNPDFRRLGILATLHPVFCDALQHLHQHTSRTPTPIRAILAETNTATAGDVPPAVARKRHEILFRLGYRLLEFPYVQPPLAPDVDSFDEIMLLLYVGGGGATTQLLEATEQQQRQNGDQQQTSIETRVLYDYVLDFYHSVFGYASLDFHDHWYYRLVTWYASKHTETKVSLHLPWEDVTPGMRAAMAKEEEEEEEEEEMD